MYSRTLNEKNGRNAEIQFGNNDQRNEQTYVEGADGS